jgi:hypothetical protein
VAGARRGRDATALSESIVGAIAQLIIGAVVGQAILGADQSWIKILSAAGAIVLTFLAGAELDPRVFRPKWRETRAVGVEGFAPAAPRRPASCSARIQEQVWLAGMAFHLAEVPASDVELMSRDSSITMRKYWFALDLDC